MALVDENNLNVDTTESETEFSNVEEVVDQQIQQEVKNEEQQQPQEEELPEKYKGKSVADIIKMHQESEKLIGRQGSEVGELRKIVDDFIKSQVPSPQAKEVEVEDVDIFSDPDKAVDKLIKNHPDVKEAKEAALAMKRAESVNLLLQKHPDMEEIVKDASFHEWVKGNKTRLDLFLRADQQYDTEAGDFLLNTWKERKEATKKVVETANADRQQQLKAASNLSQGSSEKAAKKIYRRQDIIELMTRNPDKYEALYPEIALAYQEGRVR